MNVCWFSVYEQILWAAATEGGLLGSTLITDDGINIYVFISCIVLCVPLFHKELS